MLIEFHKKMRVCHYNQDSGSGDVLIEAAAKTVSHTYAAHTNGVLVFSKVTTMREMTWLYCPMFFSPYICCSNNANGAKHRVASVGDYL